MKYLFIAALLIGCSKEPMSTPQPPQVDSIIFTANMGYGSVQIVHNGIVLDANDDQRGAYRYATEAASGEYLFHYVSVSPGFTTAYITYKDTVRDFDERPHGSRIMGTLKFTK